MSVGFEKPEIGEQDARETNQEQDSKLEIGEQDAKETNKEHDCKETTPTAREGGYLRSPEDEF